MFLVDTRTKEIHDLKAPIKPSLRVNCRIKKIKEEDKEYIDTPAELVYKVMGEGYTGCKWCLPQLNKS